MWLLAVGAYGVLGLGFVAIVRGGLGPAAGVLTGSLPFKAAPLVPALALAGPVAGARIVHGRGAARSEWVPRALLALGATALFVAVFTMVKTALPLAFPVWADPFFTQLDAALHLRHDPWELSFGFLGWLPPALIRTVYMELWLLPAILLPVLLVLLDRDDARVGRYLALHFLVWVGLGNLLAGAFLSVGPVYHDALLGGARFEGLRDALAASGIADSRLGATQAHLWAAFDNGTQGIGTGVSAFPSVHVGMAAVLGFYLCDRFGKTGIALGLVLVTLFLVLSVHTGWHYAVDGYASILVVWAARAALVRRERAARRSDAATRLTGPHPVR